MPINVAFSLLANGGSSRVRNPLDISVVRIRLGGTSDTGNAGNNLGLNKTFFDPDSYNHQPGPWFLGPRILQARFIGGCCFLGKNKDWTGLSPPVLWFVRWFSYPHSDPGVGSGQNLSRRLARVLNPFVPLPRTRWPEFFEFLLIQTRFKIICSNEFASSPNQDQTRNNDLT